MNRTTLLIFLLTTLAFCGDRILAHDGKRLDVVVIDNQLFAQGYLSGAEPIDDGGGIVRPYMNTIHSHFGNVGANIATSTLPGFDVRIANASELSGHDLSLTLLGAGKWDEPPRQDGSGLAQDFGTPELSELGVGEVLSISFQDQSISTDANGSLMLASNIGGDVIDLDPSYEINLQPDNVLYFLEWELSTSNPNIQSSDSIYTIHSPDGMGPVQRLHFQSLALERHFGIRAVPEPNVVVMLGIVAASMLCVRRRC